MRQFLMVSTGSFLGCVIYDYFVGPMDIDWSRAVFVGIFVGACSFMISSYRRARQI
jgi:hypothetical protein